MQKKYIQCKINLQDKEKVNEAISVQFSLVAQLC